MTRSTPAVPERLTTERLLLRTWQPSDRIAFAGMNADPAVMEHLTGTPMSRAASDASVDRFEADWREQGYGFYAAELLETGEFVGFIGIHRHRAVPDEVEIGWRLARSVWGRGLATEGALAVRDMAYDIVGLPALISITVAANVRSIRVMEKLGLAYWREMPFEDSRLTIYRGTPDTRSPRPSTDR